MKTYTLPLIACLWLPAVLILLAGWQVVIEGLKTPHYEPDKEGWL